VAKHSFTHAERYAVWKSWGPTCFWCREPLRIQHVTIDHLIPEHLDEAGKEQTRKAALSAFALPEDFKINDFGNWFPMHANCNQEKGSDPLKPTPQLVAAAQRQHRDAEKIREIHERLVRNEKKDKLLGRAVALLEQAGATPEELKALFDALTRAEPDSQRDDDVETLKKEIFFRLDSARWRMVENKFGIATVTDGTFGGITPVSKDVDPTWQCPNCWCYGPWSGTRCLSCGRMSDPYD
jgi:hypothetical protein